MATDATGTVTSPDSIPTYNTAADAPSGKGLNNIVASIQTALSARLKLFSNPSVTGQVPVWDNSTSRWTPTAFTAGPGAPATTLPGSPTNNQQAVLVDSTSAPTYAWLFQFSTASSSWIFLGGSDASHEIVTNESTASVSYTDLATVGPTITIPRAGVYDISFGAYLSVDINVATNAAVTPKIGAAAASDNDCISTNISGGATNEFWNGSLARTVRKTCAASDVVKLQYKQSGATRPFQLRWLKIRPVTVT